jgi:hypothetical protein
VCQLLEAALGVPLATYRTLDSAQRNQVRRTPRGIPPTRTRTDLAWGCQLKQTRLADLVRAERRLMTLDLRCANPASLPEITALR